MRLFRLVGSLRPAVGFQRLFSSSTQPPSAAPEISKIAEEPPVTTTNRWLMVAPAFATHACLGTPFGWSYASSSLTRECGFVTSAASDWTLTEVTLPISVAFAFQGIGATVFGKWQLKVGTQVALRASAAFFGVGWSLAALGIANQQLWMLYLGYGFLGGSAIGMGYTPPVQALVEWFPDRKGLASSMCIAGFGSGALTFGPLMSYFMSKYSKLPDFLGSAHDVDLVTMDGKLHAFVGDVLKEVVVVNPAEIARLPYSDLADGVYVVGTGNTGAAMALFTCAAIYSGVILTGSFFLRRPPAGYHPPGFIAAPSAISHSTYVHIDTLMKTPQFWCLFGTFGFLAMGGMGLFSVAKPMMTEIFSGSLPELVTATFAASYVSTLAVANLSGRIAWGQVSDLIGRQKTYYIFTFGSIPLFLSIPFLIDSVISTGHALPLFAFVGATAMAVTCFGGVYATMPAYECDLFGSRFIGATHGRMLLASTSASLAGPVMLLTLRSRSESSAIHDLLTKVDELEFLDKFGAPITDAEQLISAKTLTISKLMELVPPGTTDPTPFLYHTTFYALTVCMAMGALCHFLLRPVHPRFFTTDEDVKQPQQK